MTNSQVKSLPTSAGVYLFKNRQGEIIYVGKALSIRARVKSHFDQKSGYHFRQSQMLSEAEKIDYINVGSEIEALLLEANLIKAHQPKYNTRLKDDKSYLYIKITRHESFPKVLTARREKLPGVVYFGPFPSAKTVRNTLKSLRRIFPYCNCNFKICQRKQSCFYSEIGLDAGPCLDLVSQKDYREIIHRLILLLKGEKDKLLRELRQGMEKAAKNEEFEKAQAFKKQIEGIEYLTRPVTSPQTYLEDPEYLARKRRRGLTELKRILSLLKIPKRIECFDISDIHGREATGSMVVFQKGEPDKSQYRRFKIRMEGRPNDVAMMQEIIRRRLGHAEWVEADLMLVDGGKGQVSGALTAFAGIKAQIPVVGLAKRLEELTLPQRDVSVGAPKFTTLRLERDSSALHLLQAIRDEAHRFALTYHRKLRVKNLFSS